MARLASGAPEPDRWEPIISHRRACIGYTLSVRPELADLLSNTRTRGAGDSQAVEGLKGEFGVALPPDYEEFLIEVNGCVGEVGSTYLNLDPPIDFMN